MNHTMGGNPRMQTFILKHLYALVSIVALMIISSCQKQVEIASERNPSLSVADGKGWQSPATVLAWNDALQQMHTFPVNVGGSPPLVARLFAMYHAAMHDALNAVKPKYATYAYQGPTDKNADVDAAVSQAVYDVLQATKQPWQNFTNVNSLYTNSMAAIPDGEGKKRGIELGHAVATALLTKRSPDLPLIALTGFVPTPPNGTLPGQFRYLPPLNYALAGYHLQKPWVLQSANQFRPGAPYGAASVTEAVQTAAYAADFNEVKDYGRKTNSLRNEDQSEFGVFWAENSSRGWNMVAREVISSRPYKSLDAWKTARLLAVMHMAIADAYIAIFDAKIHYNFWRPISAIRLGNTDGNNATTGDATWEPVLATPPIGEYPSAHAISGAAAGEVLIRFFDMDNYEINATSGYKPGVTRHYSSISSIIRQNALSRIYIGYHFRHAVEVGESMGSTLGDYVYENALKEK